MLLLVILRMLTPPDALSALGALEETLRCTSGCNPGSQFSWIKEIVPLILAELF